MMRRFGRWLFVAGLVLTMGFQQAPDNIATVNGDPIPVVLFQQRVRFARWTTAQQLLQLMQTYGADSLTDSKSPFYPQYRTLVDTQGFGRQVLDSLVAIKLVQHEAAARGITVSDADVQEQINTFFGYTPDATPVPVAGQPASNPTEIAQAFQANRDNYFGQAGVMARMGQADVIATFAEQALQVKVFQALTKDVPSQAEQVKVRHILVESADQANALLAQIRGGASFAELAKTNSKDAESAAQGGDLGWTPRGVYLPEFEAAIWNANPGDLIGPVKTQFGYHVILVEGREVHPLGDADLARARDTAYRQWLQQQRNQAAIKVVDNWMALIPADPTFKDLGLPEPK